MAVAAALHAVQWVASSIFNKLADKASSSFFGGDVCNDQLENLRTIILPKIQTVIEAAELIPMDGLERWLRELKAAAYEAEDVLDEYEYEVLENQVSGLPASQPSVANCFKKIRIMVEDISAPIYPKTKLRKSVDNLENIASRVDDFINLLRLKSDLINNPKFSGIVAMQSRTAAPIPTTSSPPPAVYGRDEERDYLINLLVSEGKESESIISNWRVPVLAICGIGGAGKTTLAQYTYDDPRVTGHFDLRMWVHVPRRFDVLTVTRMMIESATTGECPTMKNLSALQDKLKNILKSKEKFLLVLDDVWCDELNIMEQWELLLNPLHHVGDRGSMILVTTRTDRKAAEVLGAKKIIHLKELDTKECWSIIKYYAFGNSEEVIDDPELEEIGEQIIKKIKNSPLAGRMVGSQLRSKENVHAWRMILKGDILSSTRDVLLWSYKRLPTHLQQCFAFCSLYPKGYKFHKDHVVCLWIAEGFIMAPDRNELALEDIGRQYFDELVSYSFFVSHRSFFISYVIHDLLHDLAELVSKEYCFRIEGDEQKNIPATVIHLSVATDNLAVHIPNICKLGNLRTFIIIQIHDVYDGLYGDDHDWNIIIEKLTRLRVLHVPGLFCSTCHLKHLRYLRLDFASDFPESLCRLYHLQFLYIGWKDVTHFKVPECMNNLISLRRLYLPGGGFPAIPKVGNLSSLQTLNVCHVNKKRGCGIGQLKNLRELREPLKIVGLENVKDKAEAAEAMLKDKKHLNNLKFEWHISSEGNDDRTDAKVLDGLEPPPNLNELEIIGYQGADMSPSWMRNGQCLSNLQSLKLFYCSNLRVLPPLGHLHFLSTLTIIRAVAVKEIGREFYGTGNNMGFPRLKVLTLVGMENLVRWFGVDEGIHLFSCLRELAIRCCPKLMQIPSFPHSLMSTLEIYNCPELMQVPSLPHSLSSLWIIDCPELMQVPSLPHSLSKLGIINCPELMQLSPFPCSLEQLEIRNCPGIKTLLMSEEEEGSEQQSLPLSIKISDCFSDMKIFKWPQILTNLCDLTVEASPSITSIVLGHHLTALQNLTIDDCQNLRSLEGFGILPSLQHLSISKCPRLMMGPDHKDDGAFLLPSSLQSLDISSFGDLLPRCLLDLTSLSQMSVVNLRYLQSLPDLCNLRALRTLEVGDCPELTSMGNLECLTSLQSLCIYGCPKLETGGASRLSYVEKLEIDQPSLLAVLLQEQGLSSLQYLKIRSCPQSVRLSPEQEEMFQHLTSLTFLRFHECENLPSLPVNLEKLSSLTSLEIIKCTNIESLPNLPTSLKSLDLRCPKIESLPNLPTSLKSLQLQFCKMIESLPNLPGSLEKLSIHNCHPELKVKYRKGGPLRHEIDHIPNIRIM